jgi:hypothetical protein
VHDAAFGRRGTAFIAGLLSRSELNKAGKRWKSGRKPRPQASMNVRLIDK